MPLISNPIPQSLGAETKKAAKILTSFIKPNQIIKYEEVIPPHILQNAKGLCIMTVLRAGFLFSGRAGSGIIVARLPDGTWSPPSAVMTAGAGTGGMIGADLTDFIFVLNSPEAVKTFASAGTLTLGGNVSLAAGPLGRAGEASGAAGTSGVATVFSYAKSKGLYAGISLEGSVLIERKDANNKFYGRPIPAKAILSGRVPAPRACEPLFRVLDSRAFRADIVIDDMEADFYDDMPDESDYDRMSTYSSRTGAAPLSMRRSGRYSGADAYSDDDEYVPSSRRGGGGTSRSSVGVRSGGGARSGRYADDYDYDDGYNAVPSRRMSARDVYNPPRRSGRSGTSRTYTDEYDEFKPRKQRDCYYSDEEDDHAPRQSHADPPATPPAKPRAASKPGMQGIALYSFAGEESGDLAFKKGDIINIIAKSDSTDDWWTGELNGKRGIFPANYVELV